MRYPPLLPPVNGRCAYCLRVIENSGGFCPCMKGKTFDLGLLLVTYNLPMTFRLPPVNGRCAYCFAVFPIWDWQGQYP